MVTRYRRDIEYDDDEINHVHRDLDDSGRNWLPLLLIPLLVGGLLWGATSAARQNRIENNQINGPEYGVGGAPGVSVTQDPLPTNIPMSPTLTHTPTPTPTMMMEVSPTGLIMPSVTEEGM